VGLKISYADFPGLSLIILAQFKKKYVTARNRKKINITLITHTHARS